MSLFTKPAFPRTVDRDEGDGRPEGAGDGEWLQRAEADVTRPFGVLTKDEEAADRGGSVDGAVDSRVDLDEARVTSAGVCHLLDADPRRHGDGGVVGFEGA